MAFTIEVHGLNALLGDLRKYEPELYKTIRDDLVSGAAPLVRAVGADFPQKPLRNWHSSGERRGEARMPPYSPQKAQKGVRAVVMRGGRSHGILRLEQRDAGGQVYDSAGGRNNSKFVQNLDKHSRTKSNPPKKRSRLMYSSVDFNMKIVEAQIQAIIGKTDKMIQTRIVQGA